MRHYTSIEQSKKLIEAGLDPETADMWYAERYTGHHKPNGLWYTNEEPFYYLSLLQPSKGNCSIDVIKDIPCWSIGALLGIVPQSIMGGRFNFFLEKTDGDNYFVGYYDTENDSVEDMKYFVTFCGMSLVDMLCKLVCWILENGKRNNKHQDMVDSFAIGIELLKQKKAITD